MYAWVLAPLGWIYAALTARRVQKRANAYRPPCPVVCVGNINAGGTGKTPTTIALAQYLQAKGRSPVVVSRGYGGHAQGPIQVDPKIHTAHDVGDEPILMAAFGPVIVAKDRVMGAHAAIDAGADIIILDDGFQSPAIAQDISIVVVNAQLGFGNGHCIPAGPLREPVAAGMARAQICLSIGDEKTQTQFLDSWGHMITLPHMTGSITPLDTGMPWAGLRVFAFAGIAHPQKFFQTLKQLGTDLVGAEALSDHEPLSDTLLTRLLRQASAKGAQLVCTEKDAARIPPKFLPNILVLPVRLHIHDWTHFDRLLDQVE